MNEFVILIKAEIRTKAAIVPKPSAREREVLTYGLSAGLMQFCFKASLVIFNVSVTLLKFRIVYTWKAYFVSWNLLSEGEYLSYTYGNSASKSLRRILICFITF